MKYVLPALLKITCLVLTISAPLAIGACDVDRTGVNKIRADQWQGFWLGQSIATWTGMITEMDKIGGEGTHGRFYTRDDWGKPDQPAIWSETPSDISSRIDFVLKTPDDVWGADDDTDIEYMYLWAMYQNQTAKLTPSQISSAWIRHIYDESQPTPYGEDPLGSAWALESNGEREAGVQNRELVTYENFLWVSNQRAHTLMLEGYLPPATGHPKNNPHGDMIDAQLTTEIFGLLAPGNPDLALDIAYLPIRTVGHGDAILVSEFYVVMHSLAGLESRGEMSSERIQALAAVARDHLPDGSTPAAIFDFVEHQYDAGRSWEQTRDAIYQRYQVEQRDGYDVTSRGLYCNGCFASGINFAASLVSLFYGEGDYKETLKIAVLAGWDADNPAATWGGLLGYILGRQAIERQFDRSLSDQFFIHRTRKGFPNDGVDSFCNMAKMGIEVSDLVHVYYQERRAK